MELKKELINVLKALEKGEISDGYHTFNELYRYRMLYNAAFVNEIARRGDIEVVKSFKHHDGKTIFDGNWFIVVMELPTGQVSNHYDRCYWSLFDCEEVDEAPEWDGHTPEMAAIRLQRFIMEDIRKNKEKIESNDREEVLKPFNINEAKKGREVRTADGNKARIICFDGKDNEYPIIALVEIDGKEDIFKYTANGEYLDGNESLSHYNLVMVYKKRTGWTNLYKARMYPTRSEAVSKISPNQSFVDTIKVNWEE